MKILVILLIIIGAIIAQANINSALNSNNTTNSDMIRITEEQYGVLLDIKYATKDNFVGKALYKKPVVFLHKDAANRLKSAVEYAKALGYKIKIFDGFRPLNIQKELYNTFPVEGYVSNPEEGVATHTRGVALDVTLVDKKTGKDLDMGTEFDSFKKEAHHPFAFNDQIKGKNDSEQKLSPEALKNRAILAGIMAIAGFTPLTTEWWHYNMRIYIEYPDYKDYPKKNSKELGLEDLY